jgi:hypothetical protein
LAEFGPKYKFVPKVLKVDANFRQQVFLTGTFPRIIGVVLHSVPNVNFQWQSIQAAPKLKSRHLNLDQGLQQTKEFTAYQDPMAPGRMSTRRTQHDQNASTRSADPDGNNGVVNEELFLEPMMGTPLAIYIEKDVQDRDALVDIIVVSSVKIAFCIIGRVFYMKRHSILRRLFNDTIFESSWIMC